MNSLLKLLTKIISPPYCIGCECLLTDYDVLCHNCSQALPKIFSETIRITPTRYVTLHALTAYQKPLEKLIHAKLHKNSVPSYQMAQLLCQHIQKQRIDCDSIVPIPLHWQRKMLRGFNQAEILAREVSKALHKPIFLSLKRTKNTLFQSQLSVSERQENLYHAFACTANVKDKKILLIDDLYTTGATATAAARELYKHGAASVDMLVVCKVTD